MFTALYNVYVSVAERVQTRHFTATLIMNDHLNLIQFPPWLRPLLPSRFRRFVIINLCLVRLRTSNN